MPDQKLFSKEFRHNPSIVHQDDHRLWICAGRYTAYLCPLQGEVHEENTAKEWNSKGIALVKLGQYDEAIKFFDKAIEIKPQYAEAWVEKNIILKALGRTAEAEAAFVRAKELGYTG